MSHTVLDSEIERRAIGARLPSRDDRDAAQLVHCQSAGNGSGTVSSSRAGILAGLDGSQEWLSPQNDSSHIECKNLPLQFPAGNTRAAMRMRLSNLNNPWTWRILLAGYWLTLFVLTHLPRDVPLAVATKHDKIVHAAAFAALAVLLAMTWQTSAGGLSRAQLGWAWLVIIVYAGLDEWTQGFVGRDVSLWDWLADAAGAAVGLALFVWFRRLSRRRGTDDTAHIT
jgi:VanZ family protein